MKRQCGSMRAVLAACAVVLAVLSSFPAVSQTSGQAPGRPPIRLVALGDSLTAGYGLPATAAFPVVLERALKARGHNVEIVNAGVSGDTASAGLDRLDWSIPDGTDGVILELGANDMLRGLDPGITRRAIGPCCGSATTPRSNRTMS